MENVVMPDDDWTDDDWGLVFGGGGGLGGGGGGGEPSSEDADDFYSPVDVEFSDDEVDIVVGDSGSYEQDHQQFVAVASASTSDVKVTCKDAADTADSMTNICMAVGGATVLLGPAGFGVAASAFALAVLWASAAKMYKRCAADPPRRDFDVETLARPVLNARHAFQAQGHGGLPFESIGIAVAHVAAALSALTTSMERFEGAKSSVRTGHRAARNGLARQLRAVTGNAQTADLQQRNLRNAVRGVRGPILVLKHRQLHQILKSTPDQVVDGFEAIEGKTLTYMKTSFRRHAIIADVASEMRELVETLRGGRFTDTAHLVHRFWIPDAVHETAQASGVFKP